MMIKKKPDAISIFHYNNYDSRSSGFSGCVRESVGKNILHISLDKSVIKYHIYLDKYVHYASYLNG